MDALKQFAAKIESNPGAIILEIVILSAMIWGGLPPSTTIYLGLLCWLLLHLRGKRWHDLGLRSPQSWRKTMLISIATGLVYFILATWLLEPALKNILNAPVNLEVFDTMQGNWKMLLVWLAASWILGAFGEELVYRGYIQNRVSMLFSNPSAGLWAGAIVNALLFGLAHDYQGINGIIMSIVFGLVISIVYLRSGRNLWACFFFHGVYNTPGLIMIFLGMHL